MSFPSSHAARFVPAAAVALVHLALTAGPVAAQNAGRTGLYVSVPAPLTSDAVSRIKKRVDDARGRGDQRPAAVVFDFTPGDKDAAADAFGVSYELAKYVADLHDVSTIGFVRAKVTGHLVLPVLACKELAVGGGGAVGSVIGPAGGKLPAFEAQGYDTILKEIRPSQAAVARKMFDPDVKLRKGKKAGGAWYFDLRDRDAAEKDGVVVGDTAPLPAAPDGRTALVTAAQAVDLGLARSSAADRNALAEAFGLAPASLRDDPLGGQTPTGFRFVLRGPIDQGVRESVRRVAEKVRGERGNVLVIQIENAGGGDFQAARDLAEDLRKLQADGDLLTVAFVPERAPDTAAVVALGCSEIVMSRRKDATPGAGQDAPEESRIGEFEQYLSRRGGPPANADAMAASLRDLAESQGYPPLLAEGMVNRDVEIVRARAKADRAKKRLMTAAELEANKADWESDGVVKPKGQWLALTATQAEQAGLARFVVETRDPADVYARYGLDPAKVRDATPAWLDRFAKFLRLPGVTVLLVVIGFVGLFLELKVPGAALPGIVAALCFVLVFWAQTRFSGQVAVLAGMLFLLGLVLLLLEVFVTPGFGAPGICGIVLMLGGLALVTLNEVPQTGDEWLTFAGRMATYLFGMMGAIVVAFALGRFLPSVPYANRLMLPAPDDAAAAEDAALPGAAQAAGLLGAIGTAATVLRPAGSVRFGDQYVDVVTEGGFVPAGARVQVVEVEGNRIVVKEV